MAFSNNQVLAAADLNNLADLTTNQTFTGVQSFNGAGNPKVNSSADFVEQSSAPATPSAGNARVYVDNTNPPLVKVIQDDGDVQIVGGWQYNETQRSWEIFDRDLTTLRQGGGIGHIVVVNDMLWAFVDTTNEIVHTLQGTWKYLDTGTSTFAAGSTRNGGSLKVTTAATANDRFALMLGANGGSFSPSMEAQYHCIINVVDTADTVIQAGFGQDPSASLNPGTDGIYFQYDSNSSANWRAIVRQSSTNSDSDTGVAIATGLIHLLFVVDNGVDVKFYTRTASSSAWTLRATNTGTQPAGSAVELPFVKIETRTTAGKAFDIHRIGFTANIES